MVARDRIDRGRPACRHWDFQSVTRLSHSSKSVSYALCYITAAQLRITPPHLSTQKSRKHFAPFDFYIPISRHCLLNSVD